MARRTKGSLKKKEVAMTKDKKPVGEVQRAFFQLRKAMMNASGYSHGGASFSKKSTIGWIAGLGDADDDIVENIETLRARSRSLFMTSPIATGAGVGSERRTRVAFVGRNNGVRCRTPAELLSAAVACLPFCFDERRLLHSDADDATRRNSLRLARRDH